MREAIANVGVFNLIITFVIILLAFFIGSLSYSKAFKVKSKIIGEIEKDQGYVVSGNYKTEDNIQSWLAGIGYRVNTDRSWKCPTIASSDSQIVTNNGKAINTISNYQYCVYEFNTCIKNGATVDSSKCGKYYRVVAYMYFDVPIFGDLVKIPVTGETVTFTELNS